MPNNYNVRWRLKHAQQLQRLYVKKETLNLEIKILSMQCSEPTIRMNTGIIELNLRKIINYICSWEISMTIYEEEPATDCMVVEAAS